MDSVTLSTLKPSLGQYLGKKDTLDKLYNILSLSLDRNLQAYGGNKKD